MVIVKMIFFTILITSISFVYILLASDFAFIQMNKDFSFLNAIEYTWSVFYLIIMCNIINFFIFFNRENFGGFAITGVMSNSMFVFSGVVLDYLLGTHIGWVSIAALFFIICGLYLIGTGEVHPPKEHWVSNHRK